MGVRLNYAAQRVPGLYLEMVHDKIDNFGLNDGPRGFVYTSGQSPAAQPTINDVAQHPALFDFADPNHDTRIHTGR
jgi:hypothetical protein